MERHYGDAYRSLHEAHWWWRAREALVLELVRRLADERGGRLGGILDVGCGDGLLLGQLARYGEPEGVESDPALVSKERSARWPIHVGRLDASFAPRRKPDLVLMLDVVEHVEDDVGFLATARRLLRPEGRLVVTVPAWPALWTSHDELNHHVRRYRPRELAGALEAAGFEVEELRPFFHWLALAKLLVVAKEKLLGSVPAIPRIPPAPLNALLLRACRIEQRLARGVRPPVGASLLAVARPAG